MKTALPLVTTQPQATFWANLGIPPVIASALSPQFVGTGLGFLLLWYWISRNPRGDAAKLGTARWAKGGDIRNAWKVGSTQFNHPSRVLTTWINDPEIKGKLLGGYDLQRVGGSVIVPSGQRGTLICGGPGSGKTFSSIDPMIQSVISQGLPLIVYDYKYPKGQAETHMAYALQQGYDVKIFAPGFPGSESCNILDFMKDSEDGLTAAQIGRTMARNFSLNGGDSEDPFFSKSGDQLIKAVMQTAKMLDSQGLADVATCQSILQIPPLKLIKRIKTAKMSPWVKISWTQFLSMEESEKTAASVAATAALMFTNMIDKDILPCLCGKSTIPLKLQGRQMLVLGMDENRRDIVGPIIATVLEALIRANFADGQRVDPLAIFVDELPSIYLPNLGDWLNQLRSRGACFYLGFQTISLLERAYQEAGLKAILTGCNTKIIFNPNEFDSADYFSKFLGEIELNFSQRTRSQGGQGGSSNSYADQRQTRSLITSDEINRLPQGHCILINPEYGNKKEAYVPQRLNIQVGDDAIFKAQFGAANFPLIIQMLQQHKAQDAVIDLEARTLAIDQLIPPLVEEGAKQSWQDAMGDALASAVAQPVVKEKQVKQSIEDAIRAAQKVPF